ncbi:hypothetical protein [Muriicola sp. Z0-33]|uniref:hypothetical protein n=1 Tax=Muriicola sp. Z0-33 TaxID=2816957 RepID=UPI0022384734|nr:hypothetical protein [Muriicola sp. Z0-33]MCW5514761.1 hypothetical protein [Muriicola sp. Z0-33]
MKRTFNKSLVVVLLSFGMLLLNSCNKQKAAAIMDAAKLFGLEAVAALESIHQLSDKSSTAYSMEDMQKDLIYAQLEGITDSTQINPQLLNTLTQVSLPLPTSNPLTVQIDKLKEQYINFSTTFDALYQGNYFAANAVKKSEAHAIRLTLQLITLAEAIERTPYQFTAERSDLLARIYRVKTDMNSSSTEKSELLAEIASEIMDLTAAERNAKNITLMQCLKAAERGKTVADLARNYKKMSLGQMLNIVEGPISYSLQFMGDQQIGVVMTKYIDMKATIQEDPYWGGLIAAENQ